MIWSSAIRNPTVAMALAQKQSANVHLFDAYFRRADLDRDDQISGNEAVAFFQGSGLPKQILAQAFNNSNQCPVLVLGTWQPQLEEGHRSQLLLLLLRKISRNRVPELEEHLINQLSTEEVNSLNSKFKEATEADEKG